jgi:hypothetical protein
VHEWDHAAARSGRGFFDRSERAELRSKVDIRRSSMND